MLELSQRPSQANSLWTRKFFLLIAANFTVFISIYMLIISLPIYMKSITGNEILAGLATSVFVLAAVFFRPFAGRIVDTRERKSIFLFGTVIFFVAALAIIWAPTVLILLAARFIQGFGWAYCNTASGALVADVIPKSRFGEGLGYYGVSVSIAMAIAPALTLFLIEHYNFQFMFYVCAGFVLLSFIFAFFIKHHSINQFPNRSTVAEKAVFLEKKALRPSIVIFFFYIGYASILSFLPLYGQYRHVTDVGLFFTMYAISITISRPLLGRLVDRKGYDIVMVPGLILCILTLLIFYVAHTLSAFIFAGLIFGIVFGAVQPTLQVMSIVNVPPERRGAATATFFTFLDLGLCLGSLIWGMVVKAVGYDIMYLLAIIPTVISLFVYLLFARQAKM